MKADHNGDSMKVARLPSILIILTALLAFFTAPATASLPQGPWLDLLEIRADQAMEARDYAEVLRVADLYRQAGGDPGIKLRAQEIVARARHAGNPGSALVPLGRLIAEAGPEHEFYPSALRLYAELEREAQHPHYRAPAERQQRPATVPGAPSRSPMIQWEGERQEREEQAQQQALREAADRRAREGAQRASYLAEVQATVERRWRIPEGSSATDEAVVLVQINPNTGRILSYDLQRCSGGEAFCASVHQTMDRLQSLPRPPDAAEVRGGIRIRLSPPG